MTDDPQRGERGEKGERGPQGEPGLVTTWQDVESLIKAHAFPKWAGRLLGVVCVVLIGALGLAAKGYVSARDLASQNKAGAVVSCNAGNHARATNELIWDEFLNDLINNPNTAKTKAALEAAVTAANLPPAEAKVFDSIIIANWTNNPADVTIAHNLEAYIASHEFPTNCAKAYNA